jgi:hypothetical protein
VLQQAATRVEERKEKGVKGRRNGEDSRVVRCKGTSLGRFEARVPAVYATTRDALNANLARLSIGSAPDKPTV